MFSFSAGQKRVRDDYAPDVMAENGNYAAGKGHFCQLNSLWSVWYGLLATVLNVYSVLLATRRLSGKTEIYNNNNIISMTFKLFKMCYRIFLMHDKMNARAKESVWFY